MPKPLFAIALTLLVMFTGYTRATAPWRFGVINDEMHHLESWRNRYRTDDIYPLFLEKLESNDRFDPALVERVRGLYESGPLFQRALIALVDPQPPTFPVLAEIVEAITHSNLHAIRLVSALASALAVLLMGWLGRGLRDPALGLWLAALLAIGLLPQAYAGIARPYALAQCALVGAIYAFVREQQLDRPSSWRFWLAALFAQSTQWMVWAIVGPLAVIELGRRLRRDGFGRTLRQTWWYAGASGLLLPVMVVQLMNPTISGQAQQMESFVVLYHLAVASPFSLIDPLFGLEPLDTLSVAGMLALAAVVAGVGCVVADVPYLRAGDGPSRPGNATPRGPGLALPTVRAALGVTLLLSLVIPFVVGSGTRFMMTYLVVPTIFVGIGIHWLCRVPRISGVVVIAVLVLFGGLRVGWPEDPYRRAVWGDTDYGQVAERLRAELGPDDVWCGYPYYRANCLYRYGPFPDPIIPANDRAFGAFLVTVPRSDHAVLIFGREQLVMRYPILGRAREQWTFPNGYVLLKFPPTGRP